MEQFLREVNVVLFTSIQLIQNLLRYFLFAGGAFALFWVYGKNRLSHRRIQKQEVSRKQIRFEITRSFTTILIFALSAGAALILLRSGLTRFYFNIADHGWPYFVFSLIFIIMAHDTYFYWTHRWLHLPGVYERFHLVHHTSSHPTPWTSFSFHPIEALINSSFGLFMVIMFPFHPGAIVGFVIYSTLFNVIGHLGYEIYGKGFARWGFLSWFLTPTYHHLHHSHSISNYGLYFRFWDKVMKTDDPRYESRWISLNVDHRRQKNRS